MTLAHLLLFLFLFVAVLALYVLYVVVRRSGEDRRMLPMLEELRAETRRLRERLDALERAGLGGRATAPPEERAPPPPIAFEPTAPTVTLTEDELMRLGRSIALQIRTRARDEAALTANERHAVRWFRMLAREASPIDAPPAGRDA